jgi:hypothetical protein
MVACDRTAPPADRSVDERRLLEAFRRLPAPLRDSLLRDAELRSFNFPREPRHG